MFSYAIEVPYFDLLSNRKVFSPSYSMKLCVSSISGILISDS